MLLLFLYKQFIAVIYKERIFTLGKTAFQMKKYYVYLVINNFQMRGNISLEMSRVNFEN